jgi:hypothetical protein
MFKKEFRDAVRQMVECLFILIAVPLGFLLDRLAVKFHWDFSEIFIQIFTVMIFLFAAYGGLALFQSEKKDRALEYMLSLPLSTTYLAALKIATRFLLLAGLYGLYLVFAGKPIFSPEGLYLVFIFAISVSLSMAIDSIVIGVIGILLIFMLHFFTGPTIAYVAWKIGILASVASPGTLLRVISGVLVVLPFGIAFGLTVRRLEAKPFKLQMKPYARIALPSFLVLIVLILLFYSAFLAETRRSLPPA